MSMKIFRLGSFLFAFVFVAVAFGFDSSGFAGNSFGQNANSSTTMSENSNTGTTRRRRGRRQKAPATPPAESPAMPATESTAPATAQAATPVDTTEQTDLSGTYAGTFDCADAGLTGETTLTITGNQFTTSDGKSGRITAATTRGYTGVAMQIGELTPGTKAQPSVVPTIISMRAKKSRDRLTLTSVEGTSHVCSFTPARSRAAKARRMPHQATTPAEPAKPAPAAEPVAAPVTPAEPVTPGAEAGPMPPAAPTPARRGRRGSAKPKPTPAPPGF